MEENQQLEEELGVMRKKDHDQTDEYRTKLEKYTKNTST
jgi:hypothetical protein